MALTSALFTGLSGLDANQTWLNVIGNNIANVNTVAFKASTVQFSPQAYVTDEAGTAPDGTYGGNNPSQRGLGTQVASISQNFNPGAIQSTGVDTDLAVSGDGFFVINSPAGQQFTRDGAFSLNSNNQLVNSNGAYVQGYGVDSAGNVVGGSLQNISIPLGQQTISDPTQNISLTGNLDSGGQVSNGASILTSQSLTTLDASPISSSTLLTNLTNTTGAPTAIVNDGDTFSLAGTVGSQQLSASTFTVTSASTVGDLENFVNQAMNINTSYSTDTPPPGATMQVNTGANTAQFTIIGNTGTANALTLGTAGLQDTTSGGATSQPFTLTTGGTFTDPASGTAYTNDPTGESVQTTVTAYDSLGTPINISVTASLESTSDTGDTWRFYANSPDNLGGSSIVGTGTLTFNSSGALTATTGTQISVDRAGTGAASPQTINLDFSGMTGFASTSSQMVMQSQDGSAIGTLTSFSVGDDGSITGAYSNGLTKIIGQVALANFANPAGLVNEGQNIYETGADSGSPEIGPPGTLGTGTIQAGALEQSNVDLSQEFINLIIASTGFSSSSKVITTSDELLTNLLNTQH